ncbi:MAG: hypothetical protein AAFX99_16885, partial [Myxococcota bacterium]
MNSSSPRILLIVATGRSGSVFLHTLFDGHPQVLTYPLIGGLYLGGRHCFDDVEHLISFLMSSTQLRRHVLGLYDPIFGSFKEGGHVHIDGDRLFKLLREELGAFTPLPRRQAVLGLHRAWGRYQGLDPDHAHVIVEHVHHPYLLPEALKDFPEAFCINTIRDPRPGLYSKRRALLREVGYLKGRTFYLFCERCWAAGWKMAQHPPPGVAPGRCRLLPVVGLGAGG